MSENNTVYRERACLIAHLTSLYPSVGCYNAVDDPEWLMVYVEMPVGQMAWHISPEDVDLFEGLCIVDSYESEMIPTDEKYERLQNFTSMLRKPSLGLSTVQNMSAQQVSARSRLDVMLSSYPSRHVAAALRG